MNTNTQSRTHTYEVSINRMRGRDERQEKRDDERIVRETDR